MEPDRNEPGHRIVETSASLIAHDRFGVVDAADRALLAAFAPALEWAMPELLRAYHVQLRAHCWGGRHFRNSAAVDQLAHAQHSHWTHLFAGRFDAAYLRSLRINACLHRHIALDPRWFGCGGPILESVHAIAERHANRGYRPARERRVARLTRVVINAIRLDADAVAATYNEETGGSHGGGLTISPRLTIYPHERGLPRAA
jgi:hypothetical protein